MPSSFLRTSTYVSYVKQQRASIFHCFPVKFLVCIAKSSQARLSSPRPASSSSSSQPSSLQRGALPLRVHRASSEESGYGTAGTSGAISSRSRSWLGVSSSPSHPNPSISFTRDLLELHHHLLTTVRCYRLAFYTVAVGIVSLIVLLLGLYLYPTGTAGRRRRQNDSPNSSSSSSSASTMMMDDGGDDDEREAKRRRALRRFDHCPSGDNKSNESTDGGTSNNNNN